MNCKRSSCEGAALRGKVIFLPRYDTTKSTKNYFLSLSIVVCHILTMVDADPTSDDANETHGEKLQDNIGASRHSTIAIGGDDSDGNISASFSEQVAVAEANSARMMLLMRPALPSPPFPTPILLDARRITGTVFTAHNDAAVSTSQQQVDQQPSPPDLERRSSVAGNILIVQDNADKKKDKPSAYLMQRTTKNTYQGSIRVGFALRHPEKNETGVWELEPKIPTDDNNESYHMVAIKIVQKPQGNKGKIMNELSALQWITANYSDTKGDLKKLELCHRNISMDHVLLGPTCTMAHMSNALRIPTAADSGVEYLIESQVPCGSDPQYVAPELLKPEPFDGTAVDLWSTAIILFIMLLGNDALFATPLPDDPKFEEICMNGNLKGALNRWVEDKAFLSSVSDDALDLLQGMLRMSPRDRLTLKAVKEHKWVTNGDVTVPEKLLETARSAGWDPSRT